MSKFFNWLKKDKSKATTETSSDSQHELDSELTPPASASSETYKNESSEKTSESNLPQDIQLDSVSSQTSEEPLVFESSQVEAHEPSQQLKSEQDITESKTIVNQSQIVSSEPAQENSQKVGFFGKLKRSLARTKQSIGSGLAGLFRGKSIDDELFEELETQLLVADLGMNTTVKLIEELTDAADRRQLKDGEALYELLKQQMSGILTKVEKPLTLESNDGPFVMLMVGVNGVGKTTTIGKMAKQFERQGKKVMLAAGDTFRAAAVEQLQVWGERNNIPVVAQHTGADSASVIFDAYQSAKAKNIDVLIADTAGRLQNKDHLMEELKKVVRVMKKISPEAPHEIMLTLDASTGQNAVSQTKLFHEAVGLTGISLTKLDGTAKGGVIFAIADEFNIPIRYIGIGEGIDDLRPFNGQDFVDALFTETEE